MAIEKFNWNKKKLKLTAVGFAGALVLIGLFYKVLSSLDIKKSSMSVNLEENNEFEYLLF